MITTKNIIEFLNSQEQVKELYINEFVSFDFGPLELQLRINVTGEVYEIAEQNYFGEAETEEIYNFEVMDVYLVNESGDELNLGLSVKELKEIESQFKGEAYNIIRTEFFENL